MFWLRRRNFQTPQKLQQEATYLKVIPILGKIHKSIFKLFQIRLKGQISLYIGEF